MAQANTPPHDIYETLAPQTPWLMWSVIGIALLLLSLLVWWLWRRMRRLAAETPITKVVTQSVRPLEPARVRLMREWDQLVPSEPFVAEHYFASLDLFVRRLLTRFYYRDFAAMTAKEFKAAWAARIPNVYDAQADQLQQQTRAWEKFKYQNTPADKQQALASRQAVDALVRHFIEVSDDYR